VLIKHLRGTFWYDRPKIILVILITQTRPAPPISCP